MAVIVAGIFTHIFKLPAGWRTEGTYFGRHTDRQLAQLHALQKECGLPLVEMAARFVCADDKLTTVLLGAAHPHEIEQNVAHALAGPLPKEVHEAMEKIAAGYFEE